MAERACLGCGCTLQLAIPIHRLHACQWPEGDWLAAFDGVVGRDIVLVALAWMVGNPSMDCTLRCGSNRTSNMLQSHIRGSHLRPCHPSPVSDRPGTRGGIGCPHQLTRTHAHAHAHTHTHTTY